MHIMRLTILAAALTATLAPVAPSALAQAQQNQQWFVPGGGQGGSQQRPARPPATARPPVAQQGGAQGGLGQPAPLGETEQEAEPPPVQVQLPPAPELPAMAKGAAPPATAIGIFGLREVFRGAAAVQQLERVIGERREKLNQDVQKEQGVWREMQQALAKQRASMTPEQIRAKERELQERVTSAQRQFRDRTRMLQEAYQYGGAQVERLTAQIVRQVAESRGMNLVLHREQVPLSNADFDITDAVLLQLNKVLATVAIPPDGVSLATFAPPAPPPGATAPSGTAAAPAPASQPAAAPAAASGRAGPPSGQPRR